ncbi:MAG TPA: SET domain-containing protein [Pseudolabrys sp.]|nr:SET domain-containing protein [Pseudolabrys sp.]
MSRSPLRVGRSRTGLGLFATRPIKKRTIIIEYKGPRITNAEAERLEARGSRYMYELNSRWTIDGKARSNIARYGNHSCRPNAESDVLRGPRAEGRKGGKVIIRAIRNIEQGDEITYDYGKDYWNAFIKPIGCKCDSCMRKRKKQRAEERLKRLQKKKREAAKLARTAAAAASGAMTVTGTVGQQPSKALPAARKPAAKAKGKAGSTARAKAKANARTKAKTNAKTKAQAKAKTGKTSARRGTAARR